MEEEYEAILKISHPTWKYSFRPTKEMIFSDRCYYGEI